ncbi:MAG TPA: serine hydrolase domain-containing protein [Blastocatellia bacterium]|nr:serine hydrolase domain-containing protein [Blastocatellia bacterium]
MIQRKGALNRVFILAAFTVLFVNSGPAQNSSLTSKMNEYMNAASKQGFAGAVLIARDGHVLFSGGYGLANRELNVPNTPQTKFRIGSLTKQFTAAAILLLEERGKLSVQDSLCKYFDNCPKDWSEVTLHHLLTHTSGIPSYSRGLKGVVNARYLDMGHPYAAGALYSTVEDLHAWSEALFGGRLLSAKALEVMTTPYKGDHAYGLFLTRVFNRKLIYHGGGISGFNSNLARFPEEKITIVALRNTDFGEPSPDTIADALAAILLGEKYELPAGRRPI